MILYYDKHWKQIESVEERLKLYKDNEYKRVGFDQLDIDDTMISTVRLWINHCVWDGEPQIFETMVFSRNKLIDQFTRRYTSLEEAIEWHSETLSSAKMTLGID